MILIPREVDYAWASGLFDGEGCVTTKWPKRWQAVLEIEMVNKPTLEKFASIVGGSVLRSKSSGFGKRVQWRWRVYDHDAVRVAEKIYPFSQEKAVQLHAIIQFKKTEADRDYWAGIVKLEKNTEFHE